jgi:hypothetical protein
VAIDPAAAALVGAFGTLALTQVADALRERRRRRTQLEDRSRAERMAAYTQGISATDALQAALLLQARYLGESRRPPEDQEERLDRATEAYNGAVGVVSLVGPLEVRRRSRELSETVTRLSILLSPGQWDGDEILRRLGELRDQRSDFVKAAATELGYPFEPGERDVAAGPDDATQIGS